MSLWDTPIGSRPDLEAELEELFKRVRAMPPIPEEELRAAVERGREEAKRLGFCTPVMWESLRQGVD